MKKVMIGAIAVLFLLVGFRYAPAQQTILSTNLAGEMSLSLQITHEAELPPVPPLQEGQEWVTNTSSIGTFHPILLKLYGYTRLGDPILYLWVDGSGNVSQMNITWLPPGTTAPTSKIWTISCTGGNQTFGTTGLGIGGTPEIQDGTISTIPQLTKTATTSTNVVHGVLACSICPDGFPTPTLTTVGTGLPTIIANSTYSNLTCNGGESYINGYMTFTATVYTNFVTQRITASITGTMAGGSFDYAGQGKTTWGAADCNPADPSFKCKAIFTGTFGATLRACPTSDPYCWQNGPVQP